MVVAQENLDLRKCHLWQCSRTVDDAMMMAMMITIWGYTPIIPNSNDLDDENNTQ